MVLVQQWPFFQPFIFRQYRPGKCVLRYSRTKKTSFQAITTKCTKGRKIKIFPKGLTHGFGAKMAIFPTSFLGNIGQENVFYDILEKKTIFKTIKKNKFNKIRYQDYDILARIHAFLGYKNKKFKNSNNRYFSKKVNPWFWSKNGHFSNFFFLGNIGQENVFYDILERKNAFLGYKNKNSKKSKN